MRASSEKKRRTKKIYGVARVLHVYTSTTLFGLMLFFCLTGIFLNHRWYDSQGNAQLLHLENLSNAQALQWGIAKEQQWRPDLNLISEYLQGQFRLPQPHSIDSDADLGELVFDFKVPAGFATVIIAVEEQEIRVEKESGSLVGILNDLHKGRHSGTIWAWLIDISGVLMVFFSITGLVILYQGRRFKFWGNCTLLAGFMTPLVIYWICVPSV